MTAYTVPEDCSGTVNTTDGSVDYTFKAGDVTPKNDADAAALAHLEQAGLVTVAKPTRKKES